MNLRIDPGGKLILCVDSLAHLYLFSCISALWDRQRCFRLHRLLVRLSLLVGIVNKKRKCTEFKSYIWILAWTLREDVRLAQVQTPSCHLACPISYELS